MGYLNFNRGLRVLKFVVFILFRVVGRYEGVDCLIFFIIGFIEKKIIFMI